MDPDVRTKLKGSLCENSELRALVSKGIELIKGGIEATIASNPEAAVITKMIMKLISEPGENKIIKMAIVAKLREHGTDLGLERLV